MKSDKKANLTCFHGGDLAHARALRPQDDALQQEWVDLSTGINPFAYPVPQIDAKIWSRLPSQDRLHDLKNTARKAYNVPQEMMCLAASGSQTIIQIVPYLMPPSAVAIIGPTYEEHGLCWRAAGHRVRDISKADDVHDRDQIVILTRPNNPGGEIEDIHACNRLAQNLMRRHGLLVVDETFADGLDISLIPHFSDAVFAKMNLLILRSVGKFYGLAGGRVGFGLGRGIVMQRLAARLGPWPIAGPCIEAGITALDDEVWRKDMLEKLQVQRDKLCSVLAQIGLQAEGGALLFQTVRTSLAHDLFQHLLQHFIYVRRFDYDRELLRFGLPGPAEQMWRLEDGLKAFGLQYGLEAVQS